jgi:hypothetical protein
VFEFGGGYGSLCRLFFRLGFRGRYVIFDLPHFSALQQYFLSSIEIPIVGLNDQGMGVTLVHDVEALGEVRHKLSMNDSLFLANWSLSESPVAIRESLGDIIDSCNHVSIAYQEVFAGIDNADYFSSLRSKRPQKVWEVLPIAHLPGNWFLFGAGQPSPKASSHKPGDVAVW